jgi:hypothetical protein
MTTPVPPPRPSQLSQRHTADNFIALQSCNITATSTASSITFTNLPGNQPVTYKIYNAGASGKTAYVCGSSSAVSVVSAVASTTNPSAAPVGLGGYYVSNCDAVPAGSILTQDYIAGTDTISAVCASGISAFLEISIGYGQ